MIIEALARLGHVVRQSRQDPAGIIADVTDVANERAGQFFHNVLLVEVDGVTGAVALHPAQRWADAERDARGKGVRYAPAELPLAAAAPFTVSPGGAARLPQGIYPVPAYIVYGARGSGGSRRPGQLQEVAAAPEALLHFLAGRLRRTLRGRVSEGLLPQVVSELQRQLARQPVPEEEDALLVLLVEGSDAPYARLPLDAPVPPLGTEVASGVVVLGASRLAPGAALVAHLDQLQDAVLEAKAREAVDNGGAVEDGRCAVCNRPGWAVSLYSKNWPWFTITWEAPRPQELPVRRLAEGAALCTDCYGDLLAGANVFKALQQPILTWLNAELFTGDDAAAERGRASEHITAGLLVLPVTGGLADPAAAAHYAQALGHLRGKRQQDSGIERHLAAVVGAEFLLPEALVSDIFRLTLLYFTASNAEVQLRAVVEDVVPATLGQLEDCLGEARRTATREIDAWASARREHLGTLPYLLVRAYGPSHLWSSLSAALHRQPLGWGEVVRRVSQRLARLARQDERGEALRRGATRSPLWRMRDEIAFLQVFRAFWRAYARRIVGPEGEWTMRPWPELQGMLSRGEPPPGGLRDVEELGFAVGHLTRRFSAMYWRKTGERGEGRDFLRHRVLVFGSALTPQQLIHKGLGRIPEYALQLDIGLPSDLRVQLGFVLQEYLHRQAEVQQDPEVFLTAFWSGYFLYELHDRGAAVAEAEEVAASGE